MKSLNLNITEKNFDFINSLSIIRGKNIENILNDILSEYFTKEYRTEKYDKIIIFDETKEIWKDIPEYEGFYKISNQGRIKSIRYGEKMMSLVRSTVGYQQIAFTVNNKTKRYMVHYLVASTFLNKPEIKCLEVNHKNGIKSDNRVENLEWVTRSENIKHNHKMGFINKERVKNKGIKIEIFDKEGNSIGIFDNLRKASNHIGCSHGNLSALLNEKYSNKTITKNKYTAKIIK